MSNLFIDLENEDRGKRFRRIVVCVFFAYFFALIFVASPLFAEISANYIFIFSFLPAILLVLISQKVGRYYWIDKQKLTESELLGAESTIGFPPKRNAIEKAVQEACLAEKVMLDRYLLGFESDSGEPIWLDDKSICKHACVIAGKDSDKSAWLESLILQQMARGRASGLTFIDTKSNSNTLSNIILSAIVSGRIEDLIIIDPTKSLHRYNFVLTNQTADIKAAKILNAITFKASKNELDTNNKLSSDYIYRVIRAFESLGFSWSIKDILAVLSNFDLAYPQLRRLLEERDARKAVVELSQLVSNVDINRNLDIKKIIRDTPFGQKIDSNDNLLDVFCSTESDLVISDAIFRGKIIYFKAPSESESASLSLVQNIFYEDLKSAISEVSSSRIYSLDDPHLIFIDEDGSSNAVKYEAFFDLIADAPFSLLFGVNSDSDTKDNELKLSSAFYKNIYTRVGFKLFAGIKQEYSLIAFSKWLNKITKNVFESKKEKESNFQQVNFFEDDMSDSEIEDEVIENHKKIAWFDFGNGSLVKGRYLTLNTVLPEDWSGREFVVKYDNIERDEVGIANWILKQKNS